MDTTRTQVDQPPTRAAGGFLRRQWFVVLVGLALGGVAGLLVMSAQTKTYAATATVLVTPTGVESDVVQANSRTTGVINLDTEAQLVRSVAVAARAKTLDPAFGSARPRQIVKDVRVSVPANTTILKITYSATTARRARSGANAFANAYLADRRAAAAARLSKQIKDAQDNVASLTAKLKAVSSAEAALPPGDRRRLFDTVQRRLYTSQISTLNQELIGFAATEITPGRLVTPAALPSSPSSPSPVLDIGSGLAAGLLLGLLVAWRRISHRRVVRRPDDLTRQVDVPTVAVAERRSTRVSRRDAADPSRATDPEAYQRLAILASVAVPRPAILVISSVAHGRSDRSVAYGLAAALSAAGASVCILEVGVGLAAIRSGGSVEVASVERLEAIRRAHPATSLKESLERYRGGRELLIVTAPCPTTTAEALMVAALSDAVLLAVDRGTRMRDVRNSLSAFDEISAPMLGIVLLPFTRRGVRGRRRGRDNVASARPISVVAEREPAGVDTHPSPKATGAATGAAGREP